MSVAVLLLAACGGETVTAGDSSTSDAGTEPDTTVAESAPTTESGTDPEPTAADDTDDTAADDTDSSAGDETTTTEEASVGRGPIDAGLQPFIDQAVAKLADTLSTTADEITVQSARVTEWNDASAGCPQPGMSYAQVTTDGSAIELESGGATYWYHTGGPFTSPTLCDSPLRQDVG